MNVTCEECERVFDLFDETDQNEWTYGHDCEVYDPCEGERYAEFVASWVSGGGSPGEASQAFNQFVLGHEPPNPYREPPTPYTSNWTASIERNNNASIATLKQ